MRNIMSSGERNSAVATLCIRAVDPQIRPLSCKVENLHVVCRRARQESAAVVEVRIEMKTWAEIRDEG